MLKKIIFSCLSFLSVVSFASTAFISHRIINHTNTNISFILRQIYTLPLDGCIGTLAPHASINCSGTFNNTYPIFFLDILRQQEQHIDHRFTVKSSSISEHQSVFMTWTLEEKEAGKISLNLKMHF